MLNTFNLHCHRPFIVLYILQFHIQEPGLPLQRCPPLIALPFHLNLNLQRTSLLFSPRNEISQAHRVLFPKVQPNVMQQEYKNLDVDLGIGVEEEVID